MASSNQLIRRQTTLSILVCTYNVGNAPLVLANGLGDVLAPGEHDMYVVALQELSAKHRAVTVSELENHLYAMILAVT